jgi:replicative DNA helicase
MEVNEDIYKDLIGICLTDNTRLPYITTKVSKEDIPKGIYSTIYNCIVDLYKLGVDVDIVTVSNRLLNTKKLKEIGGRDVISDIALDAPVPSFTKKIVREVLQQTTYRKVSLAIDEFKESLSTSTDTNSTCMEYCGKINNIISGNSTNENIETISSGFDSVIQELYDSRSKGCVGLDCGYPSLNYYLGGLQKGKIYIIGARASMGKSALAMNISEYVSKSNNVLFISLEMDKKEYAQRLMFSKAGIDVSMVNTGKISDEQIEKVKAQEEYLKSLNLYIETKTPCRVSDVELSIINLRSTRGSCDLVVVDYLQLLTPSSKSNKTRETEVAEMSRELKNLAVKYNVPIIVLSQLSRALETREDKRPMLSDLRESGSIEQDADVVMFVYRDEYYHPEDPIARGTAELLIRKNRGGINNRNIDMCWEASKVKFTEQIKL